MYLKKVSSENPGLPCFCFGHSTGGGIILKVTSVAPYELHCCVVVLTSSKSVVTHFFSAVQL